MFHWCLEEGVAFENELRALRVAAHLPEVRPSESQARLLVDMMERIRKEDNCPYKLRKPQSGLK